MLSIQLVNTAGAVSDVLPEYWEYFSEPTASSEVVPVIGIKSQSDEYNKVTLMSDGSYTHEISVDPIAFYDESNELQFIDNKIVPVDATYAGTNYVLSNACNKFNVFFADVTSTGSVAARIEHSGASLAMSAPGIANTDVEIYQNNPESAIDEYIDRDETSVIYNSSTGADVIYSAHNTSLNQKIILPSNSQRQAPISYMLHLDGLTVNNQGGTIEFCNNSGDAVFTLDGMLAIDAEGSITDGVNFSVITSAANPNSVSISVTVDSSFLADPERVFPVIVNANYSVVEQSERSNAELALNCASINSFGPVDDGVLLSGRVPSIGLSRIYLKAPLSAMTPTGSHIIGVHYKLKKFNNMSNGVVFYARSVPSSWNQNTITWENQPISASSTPAVSANVLPSSKIKGTWWLVDITEIYGTNYSNGNMISTENETLAEGWGQFYKDNSIVSGSAPKK